MTTRTVLVAQWGGGVVVATDRGRHIELEGESVRGLAPDGDGGVLAIVGEHALCRRRSDEMWETIARTKPTLACCLAVDGNIFVGTDDDARLLRVKDGVVEPVPGFDDIEGREHWYPGGAFVNGQYFGPPLGIRSITATTDGATLFANVHVGGIGRSVDGGWSWQPTIDIDVDVHEVRVHPTRRNVVMAATGLGLAGSIDGGATWSMEHEGLHARYCSAVAFVGDDVVVAASEDHFANRGALYRRHIDAPGSLAPLAGGLPTSTDGIVDTSCIATHRHTVVVADRGGNVYRSDDAAVTWEHASSGGSPPSSVLIV